MYIRSRYQTETKFVVSKILSLDFNEIVKFSGSNKKPHLKKNCAHRFVLKNLKRLKKIVKKIIKVKLASVGGNQHEIQLQKDQRFENYVLIKFNTCSLNKSSSLC